MERDRSQARVGALVRAGRIARFGMPAHDQIELLVVSGPAIGLVVFFDQAPT